MRANELTREDFIVTFGLKPTRPETGCCYIETAGENVLNFREKPKLTKTEEFINKGNFLWNSGVFCFRPAVFLEELMTYEPEVYNTSNMAFSKAKDGFLDPELSK